jgi:hypothetical protein
MAVATIPSTTSDGMGGARESHVTEESYGICTSSIAIGVALQLIASASAMAQSAPLANSPPPTEPREEIALALSACPAPVAVKAAVYVRGESGYVKVRDSENGFTAITSHAMGQVAPMCMDAEGTRVELPRILRTAELQPQGKGPEEVKRVIADAYASGVLQPPSRPGVSYMLSPQNRLLNEKGVIVPFPPHVMVYAPYLTNAAIGVGRDLAPDGNLIGPATVFAEGTPRALIIVPVGPQAGHEHPSE